MITLKADYSYFKIDLQKELEVDDIRAVNETANSISFILSLANECNWEIVVKEKEIIATLKVRFLYAPDIAKMIEDLRAKRELDKTDLTVAEHLRDLLKVHKLNRIVNINYRGCKDREARKEEVKEQLKAEVNSLEPAFYAEVLNTIKKSIFNINMIYEQKIALKEALSKYKGVY